MTTTTSRLLFAAVVATVFVASAWGQITCSAVASTPLLARAQGDTEPLGDLVLNCTGGTPTPAGLPVPQVNFTLFLNTNLTSKVTQDAPVINFSEALALVDEPNSLAFVPQHPLLNCGHHGAPDNGVPGPGVCNIISNGNPSQTYDGTENTFGTAFCDGLLGHPVANTYTCGRPNAFQGRMAVSGGSVVGNVVEFLGVPFDPPGAGTRIVRFTNLRADAAALGAGSTPIPILVNISENGSTSFIITPVVSTLGFALNGMHTSIGSPGVVHVQENFATAWKDRNVSFTLANATFGGGSYTYNGGTSYPVEAAQNVPGILYNDEDGYQWQNNGVNGPPIPNPPLGYGSGFVPNIGSPLDSSFAFGGVNTEINTAGVASAGTRIALTFFAFPGTTITVPSLVHLHRVGSPAINSGVMVLTSTDPAGAGPFTPGASTTIHGFGMAVYEILYTDPFAVEYADIPCTTSGFLSFFTFVTVNFAPFYTGPGAGMATPTAAHPTPTAIPRFAPHGSFMLLR